jgi:hypothetical protein
LLRAATSATGLAGETHQSKSQPQGLRRSGLRIPEPENPSLRINNRMLVACMAIPWRNSGLVHHATIL